MEIKGIKEGILVKFHDQEWQNAKKALIQTLQDKQTFFDGAQLVLDVGHCVLGTHAIEVLQKKLNQHNISLYGLVSKSMITQEAAQKMGLITKLEKPKKKTDQKLEPSDVVLAGESAVLIRRTMRSGFTVKYKGHVAVIGDVNPGAEIIASGSVIVWGRLRGTVHAGADGDLTAIVCALDLSPTQLRIASKIAITPEEQAEPKPEVARIIDEQIVAEPWLN